MNTLSRPSLRFCGLALLFGAVTLPAGIISVTSSDLQVANRATNLLVNGSFETRGAGQPGIGTDVCWANSGPAPGNCPAVGVSSIPGWSYTAPSGAYGWWGPSLVGGVGPGHGTAVLYFGNWFAIPSLTPTFESDGQVTFPGNPTFTNTNPANNAPMVLSQTVSTTIGAEYALEFYASGEDNYIGSFGNPGVFAVDISGQGRLFLTVPSENSQLGRSQRYTITFSATQASTTLSFLNWGHVGTAGTELILDDVILNGAGGPPPPPPPGNAPEPSTFALLGSAIALGFWRLRRR